MRKSCHPPGVKPMRRNLIRCGLFSASTSCMMSFNASKIVSFISFLSICLLAISNCWWSRRWNMKPKSSILPLQSALIFSSTSFKVSLQLKRSKTQTKRLFFPLLSRFESFHYYCHTFFFCCENAQNPWVG